MDKRLHLNKISWFKVIYLVFIALFIYLLISQISSLKGSLKLLTSSNTAFDLIVVIAIASSFLFSALSYTFISLSKLNYGRTVVAEVGINFINKLLPAGVGSIGGNYIYLRKSKHSAIQAGSVVFLNNVLGVVGNLMLLGLLFIFVPDSHFEHLNLGNKTIFYLVAVIVLAIVISLSLEHSRLRLKHVIKGFRQQLKVYRHHKTMLPYGLVCQIALTLASVIALYFSLKAVGGYLPLSSIMLAYSFAIWIGTLIPTPGGFGSIEAGLIGALVALTLPLTEAVACVLLFRLVSFWLPLILGAPALIWTRKKGYI